MDSSACNAYVPVLARKVVEKPSSRDKDDGSLKSCSSVFPDASCVRVTVADSITVIGSWLAPEVIEIVHEGPSNV